MRHTIWSPYCLLELRRYVLEVHRLSSRLSKISRRVLGPDHEMTLDCESGLEKAESRTIIVTEGLMLIRQYYVHSISEDGYYVVEETKTSRDMRPGGKTVTRIPIDSES